MPANRRSDGNGAADDQTRFKGSTLSDRVFTQMRSDILSGTYKPHERLPSENDLSLHYGVSRPIVRNALERLREGGLVSSRPGSGSFVELTNDAGLGFPGVRNIADISRCYEFRLVIEPAAASLAAINRSPETVPRIAGALAHLIEAAEARRHFSEADFQFHLSIAEATDNQYFAHSMRALMEHIGFGLSLFGRKAYPTPDELQLVIDEHQLIHDAVLAGDGPAAADAMRRHLTSSKERLFGGSSLDL